jgi:hypothetical protein
LRQPETSITVATSLNRSLEIISYHEKLRISDCEISGVMWNTREVRNAYNILVGNPEGKR